MNRIFIAVGVIFILVGVGWRWLKGVGLFHLPGDIVIERPGFKFFFPLTTMLLISIVISLVAWILRK